MISLLPLVVESLREGIQVIDREWRYCYLNQAAEAHGRKSRDELLGRTMMECYPGIDGTEMFKLLRRCMDEGTDESMLNEFTYPDGGKRTFELRIQPYDVGLIILSIDVTERSQLQEQLLHAQKMEAVGRLAGGVAHDFNNILMGIMSFATFARQALPPSHEIAEDLDEVLAGAGRAADLTRQLLVFSRQQVAEPKIVNINELVIRLDKLLRRTLGTDIELVTLPDPDVGQALIDPGHFQQVLINLAINARDAMATGGKLIIETGNVTLDDSYIRTRPEAREGDHVMLAVTDTGAGMTDDVRARIFEPFFTTKEPGKGTGLGLSTCYGIVKQAGGNIWVYSEPGRGTTFKIYLPRCSDQPEDPDRTQRADAPPRRGTETILVTEDDPGVRVSVVRTLQRLGYKVLEAEHPEQAIQLAMDNHDHIHLLLTDVVMPQMGGPALAAKLKVWHPEVKVIFMSGYTDDAIIRTGTLGRGVAFLQKPFMPDALGRKIRQVLEEA